MVGQIYPTELQLNKGNSFDTEAPFLDLNLSITNGIKFMINRMILILKKKIFHFLIEMFLLPFLWCIYFSAYSFLQEFVLMLMTSTTQTDF